MITPVEQRDFNIWTAGLETGAALGGSLAGAVLVAAPFATGRAKLIAGAVGGGIPFAAKSINNILSGNREQKAEAVVNLIELGAGIAVALVPSMKWMFVANLAVTVIAEYCRQEFVWDRGGSGAVCSAMVAGGFSLVLGGLSLLPRLHPKFKPLGGDEARWQKAKDRFLDVGTDAGAFDRLRKSTSTPTIGFVGARHEATCGELEATAGRLSWKDDFNALSSEVSELGGKCTSSRNETMTTLKLVRAYHHDNPAIAAAVAREERYAEAFYHELGSEAGMLAAAKDAGDFAVRIGRIKDVVRFFRVRPPLRQAGGIMERIHSRPDRRIVFEGIDRPLAGHPDDFDGTVIVSELVRNAAKNGAKNITVRRVAEGIEVIDNAGGFDHAQAAQRCAAGGPSAGSGHGQGMGIIGGIAEARGWEVRHYPVEKGTRAVIYFKKDEVWGRVEEFARGPERQDALALVGAMRREGLVPTERWFMEGHDAAVDVMRERFDEVKCRVIAFQVLREEKPLADALTEMGSASIRLEEAVKTGIRGNEIRAGILRAYLGPQGEKAAAAIHCRHFVILRDEANTPLAGISSDISYLLEQGVGKRGEENFIAALKAIADGLPFLENALAVQKGRPGLGLGRMLELAQERFPTTREVRWDATLRCPGLSPEQDFDLGMIVRKMIVDCIPTAGSARSVVSIAAAGEGLRVGVTDGRWSLGNIGRRRYQPLLDLHGWRIEELPPTEKELRFLINL